MTTTHSSSAGFVFQARGLPAWLPQHLQQSGAAVLSSLVRDGLYAEPAGSLAAFLRELECTGVEVTAVRRLGEAQAWWRTARPARTAPSRLRNPSSACWLPTAA